MDSGNCGGNSATAVSSGPASVQVLLRTRRLQAVMNIGSLSLFADAGCDSQTGAPLFGVTDFGTQFGLLPREKIELMLRRKMIQSESTIEEEQLQPASLDLRLGPRAYRVRASFLPGNS